MKLRIGTRASALARWQADWVAARLTELGVDVALVPIRTTGDRQRTGSVASIGTQGVFTREIQQALLEQHIDLAVHSLKDLPTERVPGLMLAAVPERAPAGDVLVCPRYGALDALPPAAVLGSGSLRRRSQLLSARPDLRVEPVRGNVDTRLAKLDRGAFDGLLLAEAGLRRLRLGARITQVLPIDLFLPAIGQGALGLEVRRGDQPTSEAVRPLNHASSQAGVLAERAMLAALHGGCLAPIAAWGRVLDDALWLSGRVLAVDGSHKIDAQQRGDMAEPDALGRAVAEALREQGAGALIEAARQEH
jgi:hydroxymethylbilane synthase